MGSAMKMSNYEVDLDSMEAEYGDEIMSTGWNPDVDLVREQLQLVSVSENMAGSADPALFVSEMFLRRMYSYNH